MTTPNPFEAILVIGPEREFGQCLKVAAGQGHFNRARQAGSFEAGLIYR
jgi:hypothetical protein